MIELRKSEQRGVANIGWLRSRHSFSFGDYYDPQHVGFGPLLVINEDQVQPGRGFGTHGHRNLHAVGRSTRQMKNCAGSEASQYWQHRVVRFCVIQSLRLRSVRCRWLPINDGHMQQVFKKFPQ